MSHSLDDAGKTDASLARANLALGEMVRGGRSFSGSERNCVFLNTQGDRFACVSATSGLDMPDDARALALVDWDFDGDLDVWVSNRNAPRVRFMRNDSQTPNQFVALRLLGNGTTTNRDAIGARVEVYLAGNEQPLIRTLRAGEGFLGQSSKWVHFGLGADASIEKVVVRWPGGDAETFGPVEVGQHYQLVQDSGNAQSWTPPERTLNIQPSPPVIPQPPSGARVPLAYRLPMLHIPYEDFDGKEVWARFDAKRPVLINLWASWCLPCVKELGEFTERADDLRAAGIDVVALSVDDLGEQSVEPDASEQLAANMKFPFSIGRATPLVLKTLNSMHHRQIPMHKPLPLPTSFLVDAKGYLAVIYKGPVTVDQLIADVKNAEGDSGQRFERAARFEGRMIDDPTIQRARHRVEALIRFQLATTLENSNRLEEAVRHYQGVLDLFPDYAEVHNNLGNISARMGNIGTARAHLHKAIKLKPDLGMAHHNLANVDRRRGALDAALAGYAEAIRLEPQHAGFHVNFADALLSAQQPRRAAEIARRATEIDPEFDAAWFMLGVVSEQLGEPVQAAAAYKKALSINPDHPSARKRLSQLNGGASSTP